MTSCKSKYEERKEEQKKNKHMKQNFSSMIILYIILVGKPGVRRPFEKSRHRWDDFKTYPYKKNMLDYGLDSTGPEMGLVAFFCENFSAVLIWDFHSVVDMITVFRHDTVFTGNLLP